MASGNLYKVANIEGKGMGCVAIDEIKPGTLILKEKPQCIKSNRFEDIVTAYFIMNKSDQDDYMQLYNKYNDQTCPQQTFDPDIVAYANKFTTLNPEVDRNFIQDIIGIYKSNAFNQCIGIKISRFNHSCVSNSAWSKNDHDPLNNDETIELEVRAIKTIKPGMEITTSYIPNELGMKTLLQRRKILSEKNFGFICTCELCSEEEEKVNDNQHLEVYNKYQQLDEKQELIKAHCYNNQKNVQFRNCTNSKSRC